MLGALGVAYPDQKDAEVLGKLRWQNAIFGRQRGLWSSQYETSFAGFDICKTGLRVFDATPIGASGTFFAPWAEVSGKRHRYWIMFVNVELSFGDPEVGVVTISNKTARRIAKLSAGLFALPEDGLS